MCNQCNSSTHGPKEDKRPVCEIVVISVASCTYGGIYMMVVYGSLISRSCASGPYGDMRTNTNLGCHS